MKPIGQAFEEVNVVDHNTDFRNMYTTKRNATLNCYLLRAISH